MRIMIMTAALGISLLLSLAKALNEIDCVWNKIGSRIA